MLGAVLRHSITIKTLLNETRSIQGVIQKYLQHDKNTSLVTFPVRTFLTKCMRLTQSTKFIKSNKSPQSLQIRRQQTSSLDMNTNVQNNVILYKHQRENMFRNMKIFAIGQLFGWSILAYYAYSSSFFDIFHPHMKFKEYIKENIFRLILFTTAIITSFTMVFVIHVLCSRSVKYVILNKGGKIVTFITYHPQKTKSNLTVPLNMVRCVRQRTDVGAFVIFKIQNKRLYYLIEKKEGIFTNPELFDHTVGYA